MIVERILSLASGVLGKIPDGNQRAEAEKELRIAIVAGAREWGPLGVSSVVAVLALVGYALAIGFGVASLDEIVLAILVGLVGAFFKIGFKDVAEMAKKLADVRRKRKAERGR